MTLSSSPPSPFVAVLDTNVVLDWLVFCDAASVGLHQALRSGGVRWVATAAMRNELRHVLERGALNAWRPNMPQLWASWDLHCTEWTAPVPSVSTTSPLKCSDPDDQMFIDLAVAAKARWLISLDRAVLRLASRMKIFHGVEVLTSSAWIARHAK